MNSKRITSIFFTDVTTSLVLEKSVHKQIVNEKTKGTASKDRATTDDEERSSGRGDQSGTEIRLVAAEIRRRPPADRCYSDSVFQHPASFSFGDAVHLAAALPLQDLTRILFRARPVPPSGPRGAVTAPRSTRVRGDGDRTPRTTGRFGVDEWTTNTWRGSAVAAAAADLLCSSRCRQANGMTKNH